MKGAKQMDTECIYGGKKATNNQLIEIKMTFPY